METLYDLWGKRNPEWEKKYYSSIIEVFTNYKDGVNQYLENRGKIFGAGYEIYIIAFFIGLYFDKTKPLVVDRSKRKGFGQPIMYWGKIEERQGREKYEQIREYIFAALVARTNIDFIALDKGELTPRKAVDQLIDKMEQYANFGFDYMAEKIEEDPNYFFKDTAFLRIFLGFLNDDEKQENEIEDVPDSLD